MPTKTSVELTIPVYNEEEILSDNIQKLLDAIKGKNLEDYAIKITIADSASTDSTLSIANDLSEKHPNIEVISVKHKGRGRALRASWIKSEAEILAYMDADLSADLKYFKKLLDKIAKEEADIAIGSRLAPGAKVGGRTITREILSRSYNILTRLLFDIKIYDAQCGFKAILRNRFIEVEPLIENQNWFFDTELLIITKMLGLKIAEVPITWNDDPSSTVKVAKTAWEDIKGLIRLKINKPWEKH